MAHRKKVARKIWKPMASVFGSFVVTLSVFPGVTAAVPSERWGEWM